MSDPVKAVRTVLAKHRDRHESELKSIDAEIQELERKIEENKLRRLSVVGSVQALSEVHNLISAQVANIVKRHQNPSHDGAGATE